MVLGEQVQVPMKAKILGRIKKIFLLPTLHMQNDGSRLFLALNFYKLFLSPHFIAVVGADWFGSVWLFIHVIGLQFVRNCRS